MIYGRLNNIPEPDNMIFDTKDDVGQEENGKIIFALDFTPCEYQQNDILYLKIVGVEGKSNFSLVAKYHLLENYKVYCSKTGIAPPVATYPSITYTDKGTLFLGGKELTGEINKNIYLLKSDLQWEIIKPKSSKNPSKRYGAYLSYFDGNVILFGGKNEKDELLNDIWVFDMEKYEWGSIDYRNSSNIPSARFNPSGEIVENYGKIVLFGGEESSGDSRIWFLDIAMLYEIVDDYKYNKYVSFSKINSLFTYFDLGKI